VNISGCVLLVTSLVTSIICRNSSVNLTICSVSDLGRYLAMKGERGTNLQRLEPSVDSEDVSCSECYSLCWRAKIVTVEPVVFLYMLGVYFTLSFNFQYFYQRYARDKLHVANHTIHTHFCINDSYLNDTVSGTADDEVQAQATHLTFLTTLCGMLVSIVVTIIMGPLTDQFGRKFAIVSANIGALISSLLTMLIIYLNLNLYYFIIANVVSSLFGGFGVVLMGSFSYIADISSHRVRSLRIGILELMIYVGSALTSVLMGIWLAQVDCQFTSLTWAPFLCYLINIPYALFMFPESLPKDQRLAKAGNRGCKAIWKGFMLYLRPKLVTLKLWICLSVLLVVIVNMTGSTVIDTYFYIRAPLEWNQKQIGYYGGYNSVTHGMALLLLMPIALAIGIPDIVLAIAGVVCSCVGYLFIAGVKETWQMYASK